MPRIVQAAAAAALLWPTFGCVASLPPSFSEAKSPDALAEFAEEPRASGRGRVARLADNRFHVTCQDFEQVFTEQLRPDLCWAACVAMVQQYAQRQARDQRAIAEEMGWFLEDRGADETTIMLALRPSLRQTFRERGKLTVAAELPTADPFVDALLHGNPVILGLSEPGVRGSGHVCVAYGATFAKARRDRLLEGITSGVLRAFGMAQPETSLADEWTLLEVEVFNPAPGTGRETLSVAELNARADFYFDERIADRRLRQAMQ